MDDETPDAKQVAKEDYIVRLINAVQSRIVLWDKNQKRDNQARHKLWVEIEQELGKLFIFIFIIFMKTRRIKIWYKFLCV